MNVNFYHSKDSHQRQKYRLKNVFYCGINCNEMQQCSVCRRVIIPSFVTSLHVDLESFMKRIPIATVTFLGRVQHQVALQAGAVD